MYIGSLEAPPTPRETYGSRFKGKDYRWSDPTKTTTFVARAPFVGGLQVRRTVMIRFSEDWPTFRGRFVQAVGRLTVFRSDGGREAAEQVDGSMAIEALHERMVADKAHAKAFVAVPLKIFYLQRPSGDWLLNNFARELDASPEWRWES
ncbi:MAG: hypothetical protein ABW221_22615 [Vicinamibacteria bacterium]